MSKRPKLLGRKHMKFLECFLLSILLCHTVSFLFVAQDASESFEHAAHVFSHQNPRSSVHSVQETVSLQSDFRVNCETAWKRLPKDGFHGSHYESSLVVSFCTGSLDWLNLQCTSVHFRTLTIYSKCGQEQLAASFLRHQICSEQARVVTLPNVGRVDHTIAFHLVNLPVDSNPQGLRG